MLGTDGVLGRAEVNHTVERPARESWNGLEHDGGLLAGRVGMGEARRFAVLQAPGMMSLVELAATSSSHLWKSYLCRHLAPSSDSSPLFQLTCTSCFTRTPLHPHHRSVPLYVAAHSQDALKAPANERTFLHWKDLDQPRQSFPGTLRNGNWVSAEPVYPVVFGLWHYT
jgi:hypothetical protein